MPADFGYIKKICEECGTPLILRNTRDINRKRFCSKQCSYKFTQPTKFVPPHSEETRMKMRWSKFSLLAK